MPTARLKMLVFCAILGLATFAAEVYARTSARFGSGVLWYIGHLVDSDARRAVFGDSQVGGSSYLPGYTYFGIAGQQPEEFERVVRHLYQRQTPVEVMVMASPQWFGAYHADRPQVITDTALPPAWLPLRIGSSVYRSGLKSSIAGDLSDAAVHLRRMLQPNAARAATLKPPERSEILRLSTLWEQALATSGMGYNFPWARFPAEHRTPLTLSRVFEQNPRADFETSPAAQAYRRALLFLKDKGAKLCLVRTPVTAQFLAYTRDIPGENYSRFERYITALAKDIGVPFVDQSRISMPLGDEVFVNQDHLTYDGHAAFWPEARSLCFGKT